MLRNDQKLLLVASIAAFAAWVVPLLRLVILPLIYLNTHLHELFHALAAVGTGGYAEYIIVHANGSGETPFVGGNLLMVASAGYVGAAVFGAIVIALSRTEKGALGALIGMAILLALGMIIWLRGDLVGILSGIGWVVLLVTMAWHLKGNALLFVTAFLGIQQCLMALQSLLTLFQISLATERHSDAVLMAQYTHVPSVVWAFAWGLLSFALMFVTLRAAFRGPTQSSVYQAKR